MQIVLFCLRCSTGLWSWAGWLLAGDGADPGRPW